MVEGKQVGELLVSLEHERSGVRVYEAALETATGREHALAWSEHLERTRDHVQVLEYVLQHFSIDPEQDAPGRQAVRNLGASLVLAMQTARSAGNATAAEVVACQCVELAEPGDRTDWQLLARCAEELGGLCGQRRTDAHGLVERDERGQPNQGVGSARELWLEYLALRAGPRA